MLKYQEFVDQYSKEHGGLAQRVVDFTNGRELSDLMGDDIYEYFGTKTSIGHTKFYKLKKALLDFINFTNDPDKDKIINRVTKFSQIQLAKRIDEKSSTYSSLDEVLEVLEQIVIENELHSTDATPLQSMAILIWLNYSNEDITEFKISDIDGLENLNDKYKEILKTYAGLKYYRALPSGRVQKLVQSDYLFRTANTDKLTVLDIKKIISRINAFVADKNKSFTRAILERSVAFIEIYEGYKQDVTPDIIRNYFGQSIQKAEINKLIIEYKKWAEQLQN